MATLLLADRADTHYITCCRSGVRVRLLARLRAWQLDVALAAGASPDSSAALSLRARTLISSKTRRELARAIRHLLHRAERPHHPFDPTVWICRREILAASAALEELAERLREPGPVDVRGIAQVKLLLTDGSGPLYNRPHTRDLPRSLQAAIDALEPRP